ncbi:YoaK family protein [uncultured Oscillibacter sp.]|uniref:YoaK family protein n=1 Tax=uncultured Oscillibacter sp. TaxID=876091 RepID=UPI0025D03E3B|nr:YoaK family protein [uncultured Oscillibacter sp.]
MEHAQQRLHFTMSFIGGFLAVYAVLCFAGLLGSAQTSNLILLTTDLLSANWMDFLLRIGGAILYMCAIALTVWLPRRCRTDLRRISVVLDMAAALVVGLFPEGIPPVLGLYPLFFAMAFQWNSFTGADGFVSSTIFSTNNFRQFSMALAETLAGHAQLPKAAFFGKTLLSFHCGVAISYLLWQFLGNRSAWICLLPCAAAMAQLMLEPKPSAVV